MSCTETLVLLSGRASATFVCEVDVQRSIRPEK